MGRYFLVWAVVVHGCGGDSESRDDAGPVTADAAIPVDGACDPVTQQLCSVEEKCSWIVVAEDPPIGRTDCVPNGDVALGETCTVGVAGEETGYDDCAAGGLCVNDVCLAICSIDPNTCGLDALCASAGDPFSDGAENIGVCDTTCDPVAQDCGDPTHGCYLHVSNGVGTCSEVAEGAEGLTQDEVCVKTGADCLVNGCARGYGVPGTGVSARCAAYCSPVETYLVDPDGDGAGELSGGADADGASPADCSEARIGVTGSQCRFIQSFFPGPTFDYLRYVPDSYGLCTGAFGNIGDCTHYSREWFLELYNDHIESGGTPETFGDELVTQCTEDPARCANGCVKAATIDALEAAYCAEAANMTRPTCVAGLRGARVVGRSLERYWSERRTGEAVRD